MRPFDKTKPVYVYRNLSSAFNADTKPGEKLYSIMQGGLVIMRTTAVMLNDVRFVVRPGGRRRVLETGRRNVHAFVVGRLVEDSYGTDATGRLPIQIVYNPYEDSTFRTKNFTPAMKVSGARAVILNHHGMTATYLLGERT